MASLFGRIFRSACVLIVVCAVLVTSPMQAAPFAAIVMDARSGEVLYEQNADARLHPASLTKMMTLYIAFQEIEAGNISLDTIITVSDYAAAQPASKLGLKPGQKIALRYLIRAAAVKSANDAASAIGDAISGDPVAFAKRMTRTAGQLGMDNTTFKNANGLSAEGHLSSARDMNILGRHLFYDFPEYYNIFSRRSVDAGMATVNNTNARFLDGYEGADGIKTGYTALAGFNLTASAARGKKRIIATIFGASSLVDRTSKMTELMDLGFDKAKSRVKEHPPVAPEILPEEALIAAADGIDVPDAAGGAGKTLRISSDVTVSPRPRSRPLVPSVPDEIAIAMAEGIDGALAEATEEIAADPPPLDTLDFQAAALAEGSAPVLGPAAEAETALAAADPEPLPEPTTPPDATLEAQIAALTEETPTDDVAPTILAAAPEGMERSPSLAMAPDYPSDAGTELMSEVTALESVAAAHPEPEEPEKTIAAATLLSPPPDRNAPIFDNPDAGAATPTAEPEVVVVVSTSGGRHFGVNVGTYGTSEEAERALLKTALAESATLNEGLRKATKVGESWHASFMGLSAEQAELACRRLRARAVPCETVGG